MSRPAERQEPAKTTGGSTQRRPRPVVRDAGDITALQSAAGNAAVQRLVASHSDRAQGRIRAPRTLQRTPAWLKDGHRDPRVIAFGEAVERRVLSAYGFLIANPSLGVHAALAARDGDGYIRQWLTNWAAGGGGAHPWPMFHAQAGYAVESLATFLALDDAPGGTRAAAQVRVGNT